MQFIMVRNDNEESTLMIIMVHRTDGDSTMRSTCGTLQM
jgi:hypothetical protein